LVSIGKTSTGFARAAQSQLIPPVLKSQGTALIKD
jgi:hypothetical protein